LSDAADGNLAAFFDGLREGDAVKQAVWQEYLEYLAIAVNNLHMSFDCDVIVGGYVGAFLEEFGRPLRPLLEERNTFRPDASYLKFCRYRLEASAVGAALAQVEQFLQTV
ncbi:MAG: ROK family protein, partial [Lachnospiraceae bacterium]|nr:ROK family protein [Lachnospiraceae bacterium]